MDFQFYLPRTELGDGRRFKVYKLRSLYNRKYNPVSQQRMTIENSKLVNSLEGIA